MNPDPIWIGVLLAIAFVLFASGVTLPERGGIGRRVWSVPHEEVGKNPRIWRLANALFTASGVVSAVGLVLLALRLTESGSQLLAPVSAVLFLIANILWIVFSAYRSAVIPWASAIWEKDGQLPTAYTPIADWAYSLGSTYMFVGYLATAALGGAILETDLVSAWIGWLGVVWGLALALVMTIGWPGPKDQDGTFAHIPAWVQIVPAVVAVALIFA